MRRIALQLAILLAVSLAVTAAVYLFHPKIPGYAQGKLGFGAVTLAQVSEDECILWVDARDENDYEKEHIPGALLLNPDGFEAQIATVIDAYDTNCRVVVYCAEESCQSSQAIAMSLREDFDVNAVYLQGGWEAWKETHR